MLASPPTLMVVVGTTKKRETVVVLVAVVVEQEQQKFEYSMQHSDYSDMPHSSKTHIIRKKTRSVFTRMKDGIDEPARMQPLGHNRLGLRVGCDCGMKVQRIWI